MLALNTFFCGIGNKFVKITLGCLLLINLLAGCGEASGGQPNVSPPTPQPTITTLIAATPTPLTPDATPLLTPTPLPRPALKIGKINLKIQNTPYTTGMGSDGYSWSQANPIGVDKFNKYFVIAQKEQAGHKFVFSNDQGATWSDNSATFEFMNRASAAYDSYNDKIHVLILISQPGTIGYQRFNIKRDSLNNIVAIAPELPKTLRLDFQTDGKMTYEHPVLLWFDDAVFGQNGALLAVWGARNANGSSSNEIRTSMRVLTNSQEDGQASGWQPPGAPSLSLIGNPPAVAYTSIMSSNSPEVPYVSVLRKNAGTYAKDLYFFYADSPLNWQWRRLGWNKASQNWNSSPTPASIISAIVRAGNDSGYNLKFQLGSKPVEDPLNDRIYFGFATWKDNQHGDTWSFSYVEAGDKTGPIIDVYSAGGAHSFAPTGDIEVEPASGRLLTTYLKTAGGGTYLQAFNGQQFEGLALTLFDSGEADIPLIAAGPTTTGANSRQLLVLFRDTARPYRGYFGTVELNAS